MRAKIRICSNFGEIDRAQRLEFSRIWEGEIVREIHIRSNMGGRNLTGDTNSLECGRERSCENIRVCSNAGGIAREYSSLLEYGREKSCGRLEFEGEIARKYSSLLECGRERSCGKFEFARMQKKTSHGKILICSNVGGRDHAGDSNSLECERKRSHANIKICSNMEGKNLEEDSK